MAANPNLVPQSHLLGRSSGGALSPSPGAVSSGDSQRCRNGATQEITFPSCSKDSSDTAAWALLGLFLHKPLIRAQTCKEIIALWLEFTFWSSQKKSLLRNEAQIGNIAQSCSQLSLAFHGKMSEKRNPLALPSLF